MEPLYSPTSVEEFPLRPLCSLTTETDYSSLSVSTFHRLQTGILNEPVQIWSWVLCVAIDILLSILQTLITIAPPTTVAFTLREQRRRDLTNQEIMSVASVDNFWDQISQVNYQDWLIAALRDDLERMTRGRVAAEGQDAFVQTLRKEQDAKAQTLQKGRMPSRNAANRKPRARRACCS